MVAFNLANGGLFIVFGKNDRLKKALIFIEFVYLSLASVRAGVPDLCLLRPLLAVSEQARSVSTAPRFQLVHSINTEEIF